MRRAILDQTARSVAPAAALGSGIGSLSEPLLPKDDNEGAVAAEDQRASDDNSPLPLSSIGVIIGTVLLGSVGIAASAVAMAMASGMVVVYIAGGMCALTSVAMVKNQYELSQGKSYRQGINDLRNTSNRLAGQVELLFKAVKDLEKEVTLMEIIDEQLTEIARKQGVSVESIVNLTKENEEILAKQKVNLKQTFLSDIAKAFISSEFLTGDMKVEIKSLPLLMMRLEIQLNSHGLKVDMEELEAMVLENNDVGHIIKCCGELITNPESKASSMVTILPEYAKGSLDVARGERASLKSKPKLEHRNTTVRDVRRGLSMRGIEIDSDSSSVDSEYQEPPARGLKSRRRPTPKEGASKKDSKPKLPEREATQKTTSKFKSAAMMASRFGTNKRSSGTPADSSPKAKHGIKTAAMAVMTTSPTSPSRRRKSSKDDESSFASKEGGSFSRRKSPARRAQRAPPTMKAESSDRASQGSKERGSLRKPRMRRAATMGASMPPTMAADMSDTASYGSKERGSRRKPRMSRAPTMGASMNMGSENRKSRTVSPRSRRRAMAQSITIGESASRDSQGHETSGSQGRNPRMKNATNSFGAPTSGVSDNVERRRSRYDRDRSF